MAKDTTKNGSKNAETTEQKAELSSDAKKALFRAYDKANASVAAAEKALTDAQKARTSAVLAIVDGAGAKRFSWNGQVLIPMVRTTKAGEKVAFFRGPGEPTDVVVI